MTSRAIFPYRRLDGVKFNNDFKLKIYNEIRTNLSDLQSWRHARAGGHDAPTDNPVVNL